MFESRMQGGKMTVNISKDGKCYMYTKKGTRDVWQWNSGFFLSQKTKICLQTATTIRKMLNAIFNVIRLYDYIHFCRGA